MARTLTVAPDLRVAGSARAKVTGPGMLPSPELLRLSRKVAGGMLYTRIKRR